MTDPAGGRRPDDEQLIALIDAFCDAVPRQRARAEEHGPLMLFVPVGPGWPYYARPGLGPRAQVTGADVRAVRARQRELEIPQSFEWIEQTAPELAEAAAGAGLEVTAHPLLVLAVARPAPALPAGVSVRVISPDEPDLGRIIAVPEVAFAHAGTGVGTAGATERDKIAAGQDPATLAMLRIRLAAGHSVLAAAFDDEGPLAAGSCQSAGTVAEVTGVGTLPIARRRGLGAAVTAALAAAALAAGTRTVFLSAADDAVARLYEGLGFRRIGTAMIAEPG
ncbi:MAG TPA: GNAT family N-acetyltransferase [Streptosporangiaceae bacterium]